MFSTFRRTRITNLTNEASEESGCDAWCRCLFMFIVMSALVLSSVSCLWYRSRSLVTGLRGPESRYEDSGWERESGPGRSANSYLDTITPSPHQPAQKYQRKEIRYEDFRNEKVIVWTWVEFYKRKLRETVCDDGLKKIPTNYCFVDKLSVIFSQYTHFRE